MSLPRSRALQRVDPWFQLLWRGEGEERERRLREGVDVNGIALRVVEITGATGDVIVMHPWTLHSLSPNERSGPRLTLSSHVRSSAALADPGLAVDLDVDG